MKIGILTFFWSNDNYGQLLQCYALQKFLNDRGHEVFLINYDYRKDFVKTPFIKKCLKTLNLKKLLNYLEYKRHSFCVTKEQNLNDRKFNLFRSKYITLSNNRYDSIFELQENPPLADIYIVGSDQVWNFLLGDFYKVKNIIHSYMLDFGNDKTKKISYAASWGITSLPEKYKQEITPLMKRFNYISVREETGVKLCKECGRDDADYVCDPTLLLNKEIYRTIYKENPIRKPEKPYILLYMVNNKFDFNIQYVFDFSKKKNLDVVYVTGNGVIDNYKKYFATIPEWLYLVDNAEYVITNSFHCGVFSSIFHKKYGIVTLNGRDSGMNSRFDSLFNMLGIDDRYIYENNFSVLDIKYKCNRISVSNGFLNALGE